MSVKIMDVVFKLAWEVGKAMGIIKPLNDIDAECVDLYLAMNRLPGIQTIESCCGHGKHQYRIWFWADSLEALPRLLYWVDA